MVRSEKAETYCRADQVSLRQVGETTYLIDARHNAIHQLNPVGAAIWDQLADPKRIADLVAVLHVAFEGIDRGVIERDVRNLLDGLLDAELIVVAR